MIMFARRFAIFIFLAGAFPLSAQNVASPAPPAAPEIPKPAPSPAAETASARSLVLELAGAFANDGYKVRDGYWSGKLQPGKPQLLEVNLFAGNEYWFSAAAVSPAEKIEVKVFDEAGQPIAVQSYEDGAKSAAGVEPQVSGRYFVQIQLAKGEAADFCLIYSYK